MLDFKKTNIVITVILIAFCVVAYIYLGNYPEEIAFFPKLVLWSLMALSVILFFLLWRSKITEKIEIKHGRVLFVLTLFSILYVVMLGTIGYYVSTAVYFVVIMLYFKLRNFKLVSFVTIGALVIVYLLFEKFLAVPIPRGFLI